MAQTSGVDFCATCHTMEPMVQAYLESKHGGNNRLGIRAKCADCHLPHDSLVNYFFAKVHAGLWERLAGRLVLGENVGQAARFATSHDVDAGLLPLSLVLGAPLATRGRHVLVPAGWHQPLRQRMVLLRGAGPGARAFYDYLLGPAGREVLVARGYAVPPEREAP